MFSRKACTVLAAVFAVGAFTALSGCDWFKGSDPGSRQSPILSNLSITPSSVSCAQEFIVKFRYDDPQGDIAQATVTFRHSVDASERSEPVFWPEGSSRGSGTVSFPFSMMCGNKGGVWAVTVLVEDDRGHTSNTLSGEITLNTAG